MYFSNFLRVMLVHLSKLSLYLQKEDVSVGDAFTMIETAKESLITYGEG